MNNRCKFVYDVAAGVILVCGAALMVSIPFVFQDDFQYLSVMSKVYFGLGIVEGILVISYSRLLVDVIVDYLQKTKEDTL